MTERQKTAFRALLAEQFVPGEFHHGDCIGADRDAQEIANEDGWYTVSHPPEIQTKRAFTENDRTEPRKPYLDRNHDIVYETEMLIACPKEDTEQLRSGTWATVRYARKQGKPVRIIRPSGHIV